MDGLRYYVGSLLLIACAIHGAESAKLKIHVSLPKNKLYVSSHTFYLQVPNTTLTIAAVKKIFGDEIATLAHKTPTCCCGGPCADIRAAQMLIVHKSPIQITYLGKQPEDTDTLNSLKFDQKEDTFQAKY